MKIDKEWNLGNFTIALTAEVNEEVANKLKSLGLLYLGQRNSEVDKILGGFEKKGDKNVRKVGWKRGDVEYTDALATALAKSFASLKLDDAVNIPCEAIVVRYDGAAKAEPKFAREKKKFVEKESTAEGLAAWLAKFAGYTGATHGDDGEYSVDALAAAKAAIDKFLAENI